MDFDVQDVQRRLAGLFGLGHRFVFWEDPQGDYADVAGRLQVEGAQVVDATGRELAVKRDVLRGRPKERFVVYRSGPAPLPQDDLIYDVKCMAVPFSCSMEALWSEECGIPLGLQDVVAAHRPFFNNKERRARLAESGLPKRSALELELAMVAACAGVDADNERDAVRDAVAKLLVEYAAGDGSPGRIERTLADCGLAPALWAAVECVFGYRVREGESPSIADLALEMLVTACADVMPDDVPLLSADAVRVLEGLSRNARTKEAYRRLVEGLREDVASLVPDELRTPRALLGVTALPDFDRWTLASFAAQANAGTLTSAEVREAQTARADGFWFEGYRQHYAALEAAADFFEQEQLFRSGLSASVGPQELFSAYCGQWHAVDFAYRRFCLAWRRIEEEGFKNSLASVRARIEGAYERFLGDLAERWQWPLDQGEPYPPADVPSQRDFFRDEVRRLFPKAEKGKRVGVIVSDALRFEVGKELAGRLSASSLRSLKGRVKVGCEGALAMLPSYTQLGMAALLPEGAAGGKGALEIDCGNLSVLKDGQPTQGTENRRRALERSMPGSLALQAADLLKDGLSPKDMEGVPLIFVYHDAIDARGDDAGTQSEVFEACEEAQEQIERLAAILVGCGCGTVLVTADHGFLYQDGDLPDHEFVDVEDLRAYSASGGIDFASKDRFIVGDVVPRDDSLIECTSGQLSLEGEGRIAFPRGIARLRKSGSGKNYVHGGDTLQECVIPVLRLQVVKRAEAAHPCGVQGYVSGRPCITGSSFTVTVYQEEPCGDLVTPLSVKVGIYAPDDARRNPGKLLSSVEQGLELDSEAPGVEERKTRVRLALTDDVDDYGQVVLRILARKGATNHYACAWERTLSVQRAFGSDF